MTPPVVAASRTYLRIGAAVYPVYGDDLRGARGMPPEPTARLKSKDHRLDERPLGGGRCQRSERHMIE